MERFLELYQLSKKKLHIADHMLTQTYPHINDPRLLLIVAENIFLAATNSMGSLLHYERLFKSIPPFKDTFSSKFSTFKDYYIKKYNFDDLAFVKDLRDTLIQHRKSPVEFARKGSFIICTRDYGTKIISPDMMKTYLNKAKLFIQRVSNILSQNENIFTKKNGIHI